MNMDSACREKKCAYRLTLSCCLQAWGGASEQQLRLEAFEEVCEGLKWVKEGLRVGRKAKLTVFFSHLPANFNVL